MEYYIVDRIENGFAVCEKDDKSFVNVPLAALPADVHEGAVLSLINGAYVLDANEENRRRQIIIELEKRIFSDE